MLVLETFARQGSLVELDSDTGETRQLIARSESVPEASSVQGVISELSGQTVALYRENDMLHILIGTTDVRLTDEVRIELSEGDENVLIIRSSESLVTTLAYKPYQPDRVDNWRMYLNPFIEVDHFDFGRHLCQLLNNPEKRRTLYTHSTLT